MPSVARLIALAAPNGVVIVRHHNPERGVWPRGLLRTRSSSEGDLGELGTGGGMVGRRLSRASRQPPRLKPPPRPSSRALARISFQAPCALGDERLDPVDGLPAVSNSHLMEGAKRMIHPHWSLAGEHGDERIAGRSRGGERRGER